MVTTVADEQFGAWLTAFNNAASSTSVDALIALFHPDAFWRDFLAFTWNVHTAEGVDAIREMLIARFERTAITAWQQAGPVRSNNGVLDGMVTFNTSDACCDAVIQLRDGKASIVLTSMTALKVLDEARNMGSVSDYPKSGEAGNSGVETDTGQPYCVIVGAGHCGLSIAARLQQLGVPTLVIDRRERPSDTWRDRHDSLMLHTPSYFDEMPLFPYPQNWPLYPSKNQFANWLDAYRSVMNVNLWTAAECVGADFDDALGKWRLQVRRGDRVIELNPEQLVITTGLFGAPKMPTLDGKERFKGTQQHASLYRNGRDYEGLRCVVVGSGTTAHDISADLWASGAHVTMVQRSPTLVMRWQTLSDGLAQLYGSEAKKRGITTELADLLFAAIPLRSVLRMHQGVVSQAKQRDAQFYERLKSAGFQVTFGEDEAGVYPQVLRDPGRYYIDVGASELIINGNIKLRSGVAVTGLEEETVVLSDGSELPADAVFYATGYDRKPLAPIVNKDIAEKVGWLWGFGSGISADPGPWEGEIRNIGKPTQQTGLWFLAGGPGIVRSYSRVLALQIKARQAGIPTAVYKLAEAFHAN